ncbi:GATA transcription factor 26-like isoform X1 [Actinidia eriantha]|uniref:GATA transcription factor 26-like isoform X1 n=2 Tax=Actinidia eriantha TaxID=165200 RepID=UPI002584FC71|nr:GATA transcription factor 26-like isoform X1 [Actinidia eriantha]XP_057478541.1 GATA transcription factor 26-like isoform X1 [Actinidia eriantha]
MEKERNRDMGKHGPCYHCGVTSTPLWRNGPPEKPVLCNACGSRWRTKGTLVNYTPLHARAEPDEFEDQRVSRVKSISIKNKEAKVLKRKQNQDNDLVRGVYPDYSQCFRKALDEDTSNRSSSGSAISNSESCVQFGSASADASDLTGPAQSVVWETMVPSRKRTCVGRPKPSPVEKLTKDLHTILHEQQSSHFSGSSEEDLLFESDRPMVSVEIGHGSVLIRHPSSIAREEESEASSLSVDNKLHRANEAYSRLSALPVHSAKKGANVPTLGIDKSQKPIGQGMQQEQIKRDKAQHENLQILENHNSTLCYVDLKDVLDFDQFARNLTKEEQQQLLKYLPYADTAALPDSLKSMFASPQFKENISSFQKLHAEGVFDLSLSGVKADDCRTLKRLTLGNLTKSKWVEQYNLLKDVKYKSSNGGFVVPGGPNAIASGNSTNVKRLRDGQYQNFPGAKTTMKSPKRAMKGIYEHKELIDNDGSYFSPRSLFALPTDNSSLMMDSFQFMGESSDQDLLLDVPSNSSFPEAELLLPTSSSSAQASAGSSSIYPHLAQP